MAETTEVTVPAGLRTDAPPEDGSQIVAWAIDHHAFGFCKPDKEGRWVIAQFTASHRGGKPFWTWSTPGRGTSVTVLGWLPLPCKDRIGRYATGDAESV